MVIACHLAVFGCIRSHSAWKQLRLLMSGWALPMSLPVVQFWTPLGAEFQRNIIVFLPSQYLNFVSMLCRWARHFTLTCFTWLRCKWVPDRTEMAMYIVRYVQCAEMATRLHALHGAKMAHECTSPVTRARDKILSRLMSLQTLYQIINLYCYLYRPKMYEGWSRSLIRFGCDSLSRGTGSFVIVVVLQTPRSPGSAVLQLWYYMVHYEEHLKSFSKSGIVANLSLIPSRYCNNVTLCSKRCKQYSLTRNMRVTLVINLCTIRGKKR